MREKTPDLLASYFTLAGDIYPFGPTEISPIPFRERVEAAGAAGWKGVGLIHADVKATAEAIGYGEMRKIVEGAGINRLELEFLPDWYHNDERRVASDRMRNEMFEMAGQLGIQNIKIAPGLGLDLSNPTDEELTPDLGKMAEAFSQIAREARERGTGISLEIMPFSNIRTIKDALEVVKLTDEPNAGLLVDIWHVARGNIPFEEIAKIPTRYISAVELDDAHTDVVGHLWQDTTLRRTIPGDGDLDVPGFIRAIEATGFHGIWGVEILSETLRKLPVREMAKRSFDGTVAQFRK